MLVLIMACGCTASLQDTTNKTSVSPPNPETGIHNWADAVSNKDLARLYDLEPDYVKQKVSFDKFLGINKGNEFMNPNSTLTGVEILNETSNATVANLIVAVYWQGPVPPNSTKIQNLTIYYNFEEFFEDGEWKVWINPWQ